MQLQEVINFGLEGNEYVSMLSWIMNTYSGAELMQHPELMIDMSSVGPLLNNSVIDSLQQQYLKVGLPDTLMVIIHYSYHSLYRVIDKSMNHFKNLQQIDYAMDHGNSHADR
jgi:hypothetical protein